MAPGHCHSLYVTAGLLTYMALTIIAQETSVGISVPALVQTLEVILSTVVESEIELILVDPNSPPTVVPTLLSPEASLLRPIQAALPTTEIPATTPHVISRAPLPISPNPAPPPASTPSPTPPTLRFISVAPESIPTTEPSTTFSQPTTPSLQSLAVVSGSPTYEYIGCYNEPPSSSPGSAFGAPGSYISPIVSSPDVMTVPLCLEGCASAMALNGEGSYMYVGLENSRECYCGLTLSSSSNPVSSTFCSSPCAAADQTTCGGLGFLSMYRHRRLNFSNAMRPKNTTVLSHAPNRKSSPNMVAIYAGVATGLFVICSIMALCITLFIRRRNRKDEASRRESLSVIANNDKGTFIGGFKLTQAQTQEKKSGKGYQEDSEKRGSESTRGTFMGARKADEHHSSIKETGLPTARLEEKPLPRLPTQRNESGSASGGNKRFGLVVQDEDFQDKGPKIQPVVQTKAAGDMHRSAFEAWKKGVVPPSPRASVNSGMGGRRMEPQEERRGRTLTRNLAGDSAENRARERNVSVEVSTPIREFPPPLESAGWGDIDLNASTTSLPIPSVPTLRSTSSSAQSTTRPPLPIPTIQLHRVSGEIDTSTWDTVDLGPAIEREGGEGRKYRQGY